MHQDFDFEFDPIDGECKPGMTFTKYWRASIRGHGQEIFLYAIDTHESDLKDDPWDHGWGYVDEDPPQDDD